MTQLSKERLEEIRDYDTCVTLEESAEMARRLLAAEAQEPVGVVRAVNAPGGMTGLHVSLFEKLPVGTEVYATPHPAPVAQPVQVPDELSIFEAAIDECRASDEIDEHAWNHGVLVVMAKFEACRAAVLNQTHVKQPSSGALQLPDGVKEALSEAVSAIYFADSSDYLPALRAVVKALSPETIDLLLRNEKAAFDSTRLAAAPQEPTK